MPTFSFTVNEGVAIAEKISVDTTGSTSATFKSAQREEGTFTTPAGVTVTVGSGFVTVNVSAGAATSANFPAVYYIDLNNRSKAVTGKAWFKAAPVPEGGTVSSAADVPVTSSGLTVATGSTVEEVIASIDAWAVGRPVANPPGTLANRPANGSQPNGSTYYATDDNGGQNYAMVAGVWQKRGPAVGDASGRTIAYQELAATYGTGNVAAGNLDNDVTGLSIAFNSGVRPFRVALIGTGQYGLGAATSPQVIRAQIKVQMSTDGGATWSNGGLGTIAAKVLTGEGHYNTFTVTTGLITPPANNTGYNFKATVAVNITGATFTMFGRNLGATTALEAIER